MNSFLCLVFGFIAIILPTHVLTRPTREYKLNIYTPSTIKYTSAADNPANGFVDIEANNPRVQSSNCTPVVRSQAYKMDGQSEVYRVWQVEDCVSEAACGTNCSEGFTFGKLYYKTPQLVKVTVDGKLAYVMKDVTITVGCGCAPV